MDLWKEHPEPDNDPSNLAPDQSYFPPVPPMSDFKSVEEFTKNIDLEKASKDLEAQMYPEKSAEKTLDRGGD